MFEQSFLSELIIAHSLESLHVRHANIIIHDKCFNNTRLHALHAGYIVKSGIWSTLTHI